MSFDNKSFQYTRNIFQIELWPKSIGHNNTFTTVVPREAIKNQVFLRFFANIFLLVCRMIMIFLLTQRTRLGGPFRYLEHVRRANRKFSRGLWKKVSAQKMGFCQNIPTWFWDSFFQNLNFFHFSKASRKFSIGFTNTFKVPERSA